MGKVCAVFRVESGKIQLFKKFAAIEHVLHGGNILCIKRTEIDRIQRAAVCEHAPHARNLGSVETRNVYA